MKMAGGTTFYFLDESPRGAHDRMAPLLAVDRELELTLLIRADPLQRFR